MSEKESTIIKIVSNRILFFIHSFVYLAVNALLVLIWALLLSMAPTPYFWPIFTMFGWGFAAGLHALLFLMYNDRITCLSKVRKESVFGIIFIIHAWFYIMINLFLMVVNLTLSLEYLWFLWPLGMWGIIFAFHIFVFSTWDKSVEKKMEKLKTEGEYSERHLKKLASSKIIGFMLLLINLIYYSIVNILMYALIPIGTIALQNILSITVLWGVIVMNHVVGYYLFVFVKSIKPVMKGLILHVLLFLSVMICGIIAQFLPEFTKIPIIWIHYPLILWPIALVIHGLFTLKWDLIKTPAIKRAKSQVNDREDFEYDAMANKVLFWQTSFIIHVPVYLIGIILIGAQFISMSIDMNLLLLPALGWLIGLCVHCAIFVVAWKNITGFLKWTAILHLAAFLSTAILLVFINIVFVPGFFWSAIAIAGWGIGIGLHLLLAFLVKKK